jgi:hypothetical protein
LHQITQALIQLQNVAPAHLCDPAAIMNGLRSAHAKVGSATPNLVCDLFFVVQRGDNAGQNANSHMPALPMTIAANDVPPFFLYQK